MAATNEREQKDRIEGDDEPEVIAHLGWGGNAEVAAIDVAFGG